MLLLGSKLIGMPIMSLQTGTRLAVTKHPIIDPRNLIIVAYEVDGSMLTERPSFIRIADVRELSNIGMIIDSNDEFIGINDVIAIKSLCDLGFELVGMNVIDEKRHKLGKVSDFSIDANSFIVQQINVRQSLVKSLSSTELLIHRTQIIEINDNEIIVKSGIKKLAPIENIEKLSYVNPFRSSTPQTNSTNAE